MNEKRYLMYLERSKTAKKGIGFYGVINAKYYKCVEKN